MHATVQVRVRSKATGALAATGMMKVSTYDDVSSHMAAVRDRRFDSGLPAPPRWTPKL